MIKFQVKSKAVQGFSVIYELILYLPNSLFHCFLLPLRAVYNRRSGLFVTAAQGCL